MRPIIRSAVLVAVFASTACTTMKTVSMDQLTVLGPDRAWVTGNDESVVLLWEPKLVQDTLTGYVGKHREKLSSDGVKQVRVKTAAPTRTALLITGLTVGMGALLVLAASNGQSAVIVSTRGPPGDCEQDPEQFVCTGVPE